MRIGVLVGWMALSGALLPACQGRGDPHVVRAGHLSNVTNAHGLVAHHRTLRGAGGFETRLDEGMRIEWSVFNAGPTAMERLVGGSLDVAYVGPSPALNVYLRSEGESLRVVSGATRGGSALVVQGDGRIREPADFRGKTVATPQFGNTQDVACRAWLVAQGFEVRADGGDVTVDPRANPETLVLFQRGDLDAVWTVEPWVSRLELEAGGKVFLEQESEATTVLVVRTDFLRERPEVVHRFLEAHAELTVWMRDHPEEAREEARAALEEVAHVRLSEELAVRAWRRLRFDDAIAVEEFGAFLDASRALGILERVVPLDRLLERP